VALSAERLRATAPSVRAMGSVARGMDKLKGKLVVGLSVGCRLGGGPSSPKRWRFDYHDKGTKI